MQEQKHKHLNILFYLSIIFVLGGFIFDVLYVAKHKVFLENVTLERWAILITLFGIFGSLKFLRPKILEVSIEGVKKGIKKYTITYLTRLITLLSIYLFNLTNFTITGSKNFLFLAFITIFAMFLCAPNKELLIIESNNN